MMPAVALAVFLAAHALIHVGFVSPRPSRTDGPEWPFALDRSWLLARFGLGSRPGRAVGVALLVAMVAGYATAIAAIIGLVGGPGFGVGIVVGSTASLAVLALFFHPWLVVGVALDAALLLAVVVADWTVSPLA